MAWEVGSKAPNVVVGIPHTGTVTTQWAYMSLARGFYNHAPSITYLFVRGQPIDIAREGICRRALDLNAKCVFFLDSDVILPPTSEMDVLGRLMSHNLPIVCGLYYRRWRPQLPMDIMLQMLPDNQKYKVIAKQALGDIITSPAMWRLQPVKHGKKTVKGYVPIFDGQFKKGSLIECDVAGAGCLLIQTDVLRKIKPPWFRWTTGWLPEDKGGVSEDFYFFEQAKLAGFKTLVDTACLCQHEATINFTDEGETGFTEI